MKRSLLAFLLVIAVAGSVEAQVTFGGGSTRRRPDSAPKAKNVRGIVQDLRGNPLPGARVFIKNLKTTVTRTLVVDDKGAFAVFALPPDVDYEVTADFKGQTTPRKLISSFLDREDNVINFQIDVTVIAGAGGIADDSGPTFQTQDRVDLRASFDMPAGVPAPIPSVLLLHGYGEDRLAWDAFKKQLLSRGWAVMSLDLRGHGQSRTKNSVPLQAAAEWRASAHEFPQDIDPALDWLKAQPRLDPKKIVIIGYDVGANLALISSGRFPEVRTVIAVKPNLGESLAMAGSAQDFQPRSALIVVSDQADGDRLRQYVAAPIQVRTLNVTGGTTQWFGNQQLIDATLQWLRETY